jgi:hypothetical protein
MTESDIIVVVSTAVAAAAAAITAYFTGTLWRNSSNQLARAREIERAYLAGGGDYGREQGGEFALAPDGRKLFRVDVANYGKTPAYLVAFDVQFDTLAAVQGGPRRERRVLHDDQIPPGGRSRPIRLVPITPGAEIVYGVFWYRDIWREEHEFRFVLTLHDDQTSPDVTGVHDDYRFWN